MTDITSAQPVEQNYAIGTPQPETSAPISAPTVEFTAGGVPFISTLDTTLQAEPSLKDFKDVNSLAKSFVETKKTLGRKVTDLTPEEAKSLYGKLGVPETPDKYQFEEVELPAGMTDILTDEFKTIAHKYGISAEAANELRKWYLSKASEHTQDFETFNQQELQEQQKQLKHEFGSALPEKVALANRAALEFGGDELIDILDQSGMSSHPVIIRTLAKAGALLREDSHVVGEPKGALTPSEAAKRVSKNLSDPAYVKAWRDFNHPRHTEVVNEMKMLSAAQLGQ